MENVYLNGIIIDEQGKSELRLRNPVGAGLSHEIDTPSELSRDLPAPVGKSKINSKPIFEKPKDSLILNQPVERTPEPFAHANTQFDGGRQGSRWPPEFGVSR